MRKINLLLVSLLVLASNFFTSCKKDDDPDGPVITFSNDQTSVTLQSGTTQYEINGNITSVAGLDEVKFSQVTSEGEDQLGSAVTSFQDKNNYDFKFKVSNVVEKTVIKISATDKNNVTNSKNFTINVTTTTTPQEDKLIFYTGTLAAQLGAQGNTTIGSSYSTSNGAIYLTAAAKTNAGKVDFIYFYSTNASVLAEMISPKYAADNGNVLSANSWSVKNETKFKDVSSAVSASQFDAIVKTDESTVTTNATGFTAQSVTNLSVGKVFAFQTAAGKLGLAKVTGLSGTTAGSITIEVKVQK